MNQFIKRYEQLGWKCNKINLKQSICTNTTKISCEELKKRLEKKGVQTEKIPFLNEGFFVKSKFALSSTPEYLQGFFQIQEAASQLPAQVLEPKGLVLDMCAAPGGKTLQLCSKAEIVVAIEPQYKRLQVLLNTLERCSISNCLAYNIDARKFEGIEFDKILLDAPCSGNFAIDQGWFDKQSTKNFERNAQTQKDLLKTAYNLLKKGGEIVYSTCSLEPEENELVIEWAIKNLGLKTMQINCYGHPGLTSIFGQALSDEIKFCRRIWPEKTQGFFIAKLKK